MSEEEAEQVEHVDGEKPTKKRARSARKKPAVKPVTTVNNRFVCNYSGSLTEKAIFLPGDQTVCFANLPCAFSYLESTIKDAEKLQAAKVALCDAYEQNAETVQSAPDRSLLGVFGGDRSYEEWMGPLSFWNVLTNNVGTTVAEYQSNLKSGGKRAVKGAGKVSFEAGLYVVSIKGAPRRVDAVDGAVEKGAKESLTPVRAYRKLHTWISKQKEHATNYRIVDIADAKDVWRGYAISLAPGVVADGEEQQKLYNQTVSMMSGLKHYGPAVLFVTRKTAVKI